MQSQHAALTLAGAARWWRRDAGSVERYGLVAYLAATLGAAALLPAFHDYISYVMQWRNGLDFGEPWRSNGVPTHENAYGPLHPVIGSLVAAHFALPRFLGAAAFAIAMAWIYATLRTTRPIGARDTLWFLALLPFNPFVLLAVFIYGLNDTIIAVLFLVALDLRAREKYSAAGGALAVAALLKFYPLLFLPYLAVDASGRLRIRAILAAIVVFVGGMGAAYAVWGEALFRPFQFATERPATFYSPWHALSRLASHLDALAGSGARALVDAAVSFNTYVLLGTVALSALSFYVFRPSWRVAALIFPVLMFLVYKVGHPQFYLPSLLALGYMTATDPSAEERRVHEPIAVIMALASLALMIMTTMANIGPWTPLTWGIVMESSIPFAIGAWFMMALALRRAGWRRPDVSIRIAV